MPSIKVREAIRMVEEDGLFHVRTSGDHRIYHHPVKRGSVTIPGRLGGDLDAWLWSIIRRQAKL